MPSWVALLLHVDDARRAEDTPSVNSSSRVQISFTGLPAPFASLAASIAHSPLCLPPYPDPVSGMITRTCSSVVPRARCQFAAYPERPLRAGPNRQLVAFEFRDRGPRLKRHVRDVCNRVGRR